MDIANASACFGLCNDLSATLMGQIAKAELTACEKVACQRFWIGADLSNLFALAAAAAWLRTFLLPARLMFKPQYFLDGGGASQQPQPTILQANTQNGLRPDFLNVFNV